MLALYLDERSARTINITKLIVFNLILYLCTITAVAQSASSWPDLKLPKGMQLFSMGQQINLNGLPMNLKGFVSPATVQDLAESLRYSLGKPLVENRLGNQLILGRAEGPYYISVQIEPTNSGSRGVVAITHIQSAYESKEITSQEQQRWLSRLPSGSQMLSILKSSDGMKNSNQIIFTNSQAEALNRDRLKAVLLEEGLNFEREGVSDSDYGKTANQNAQGRALFFKGTGKEAIATIHRDTAGQTIMVLNIITLIEKFK